ncbi:MAG: DUF2892 domain-containing protein [Moheibacter sp.]
MKINMGKIDRILRFLLGVLVIYLYFTNQLSGLWAIVLGIFAIIFFITSFIGFCPVYTLLGIRTNKKEKE